MAALIMKITRQVNKKKIIVYHFETVARDGKMKGKHCSSNKLHAVSDVAGLEKVI